MLVKLVRARGTDKDGTSKGEVMTDAENHLYQQSDLELCVQDRNINSPRKSASQGLHTFISIANSQESPGTPSDVRYILIE